MKMKSINSVLAILVSLIWAIVKLLEQAILVSLIFLRHDLEVNQIHVSGVIFYSIVFYIVPRIVIENAMDSNISSPVMNSAPVSPMTIASNEVQYDPNFSGGVDSLIVAPGTSGLTPSPNTEIDSAGQSTFLGGLTPLSPYPTIISPSIRQNWLYVDGNIEMPKDVSEGIMDSMNQSVWSGTYNLFVYELPN